MSNSILTSTKKILNVAESDSAFDLDIMTHINSVFATLAQLGIGPPEGFMITNAEPVWDDFLAGDLRLNSVKTYVFLRVRILFDPPTTSFLINALNEQIREFEWRLSTQRESEAWVEPSTTIASEV